MREVTVSPREDFAEFVTGESKQGATDFYFEPGVYKFQPGVTRKICFHGESIRIHCQPDTVFKHHNGHSMYKQDGQNRHRSSMACFYIMCKRFEIVGGATFDWDNHDNIWKDYARFFNVSFRGSKSWAKRYGVAPSHSCELVKINDCFVIDSGGMNKRKNAEKHPEITSLNDRHFVKMGSEMTCDTVDLSGTTIYSNDTEISGSYAQWKRIYENEVKYLSTTQRTTGSLLGMTVRDDEDLEIELYEALGCVSTNCSHVVFSMGYDGKHQTKVNVKKVVTGNHMITYAKDAWRSGMLVNIKADDQFGDIELRPSYVDLSKIETPDFRFKTIRAKFKNPDAVGGTITGADGHYINNPKGFTVSRTIDEDFEH